MALSILRRPSTVRLSDSPITTYSITDSGYGAAILSGGVGLADGDTVFIANSFDSYCGFWILSAYGPAAFRLQEYTGADYLQFTQADANVELYTSVAVVTWSCVHLPIVYLIQSNLWPVNTFDAIRAVTGFANDNGYVRLTLSGAISVQVGDWLNIQATSEDELDGPFQILTKYSDTQYTIDAPYSIAAGSAYTYSTATAQRYYNNYNGVIRVYAGLNNTHQWVDLKPYELITELRITPNADNQIMLNIAEVIKQKIQVLKNRPNYDSIPFDLDRFTQFYITYSESYDLSDGTDVSAFEGSVQSDYDFLQGFAHDAKLEFKNRYSGFLSQYVLGSSGDIWINGGIPSFPIDPFTSVANQPFRTILANTSVPASGIVGASLLVPASERIIGQSFSVNFSEVSSDDLSGDVLLVVILLNQAGGVITTGQTPVTSVGQVGVTLVSVGDVPYAISVTFQNTGLGAAVVSAIVVNQPVTAKFLTEAIRPVYFPEWYMDLSAIVNFAHATFSSAFISFRRQAYDEHGNLIGTQNTTYTVTSNGVYRFPTAPITSGAAYLMVALYFDDGGIPVAISEVKRIDVDRDCVTDEYIYLTWKNALGGFDYWLFKTNKDHMINILSVQEKERNIYPAWPRSYGEHNDAISQETSRRSRRELVCRAENLTQDQVDMISGIKTSALVQQLTTIYDRRVWKLDQSGFRVRTDNEKLHSIEFTLIATAEIPSQSL